ncbi:MAG: hypothetical protein QM713_06295 [Arachnia sp.]
MNGSVRGERGLALSVWTAVMIPAFIIAVGLGVDLAGHAAAEQEARAVAGQAARAATQQLTLTADGPVLNVGAAKRAAVAYVVAAGWDPAVSVVGQRSEVTVRGRYETSFLGMIGVRSIDVEASSSASAVQAG